MLKLSYRALSRRGKSCLVMYASSLIVLSGLDGASLLIISREFSNVPKQDSLASSVALPLVLVVALFTAKSVLASLASYWTYLELSEQEVKIGERNIRNYLDENWVTKSQIRGSELFARIDRGPTALVLSVMMLSATLVAEIGSVIVISLFFLFIEPVTATATILFFGFMALMQHKILSKGAARTGAAVMNEGNNVFDLVEDVNRLAKVLSVMPSRSLENEITERRRLLARARAKSAFYESLPRYLMESLLAIGFLIVAASVYFIGDRTKMIASISIFGAVGFRLLPSINRVQGLVLGIVGRSPLASQAIGIEDKIAEVITENVQVHDPTPIDVLVDLRHVSFRHQDQEAETLSDINLKLQIGKQYAFVGPSGSGKTTLADVCLGLIRPDSGHVFFSSGLTKDSVCYVPQSVELAVGSIAQNVALEWNKADIDMTRVNRALIESQLSELIISEESVESTGRPNLSGGQIQRLGIARILYRNPIFVVFDEATSALDAQTENEIMKLLDSLRKEITVVLIAHRLTTIQNADQIIYIDNGKIEGVGSFEELRIQIPAFAKQIELGSLLTLPKNVSKIRLP